MINCFVKFYYEIHLIEYYNLTLEKMIMIEKNLK